MMQYSELLRKFYLQKDDISLLLFSSYDSDFFLETLRMIIYPSAVKIINTMQYNELLRLEKLQYAFKGSTPLLYCVGYHSIILNSLLYSRIHTS